MKELKTLKDLQTDNLMFGKDNEKDKLVRTGFMLGLKATKQEAIKWVKHLEKTEEDNVFDFLETFFNLKTLFKYPHQPLT